MVLNDTAVTLALISAVASAVAAMIYALSPPLTSVLSCKYQMKQKNNELLYEKRTQAVEEYLRAVGNFVATGADEDFKRVSGSIYLYIESEHWYLLDMISKFVASDQPESVYHLLSELSKSVNLGYTNGKKDHIYRGKRQKKYHRDA